jgi:hypoxanthine-guanine phosphoribosyltransferase
MAPTIIKLGRNIEKGVPNKKLLLVGIHFSGVPIAAGLEKAIKNKSIETATLRASSKRGEFDDQGLGDILTKARKESRVIVFVDRRTKTGATKELLEKKMLAYASRWKYAVLYDPLKKADIRASVKEGPWFGEMRFNAITKRMIQKEVKAHAGLEKIKEKGF